jgi:hypothetical protein
LSRRATPAHRPATVIVNIFTLYRLRGDKTWDLYGRGILRNRDRPEDLALSPAQQIRVAAERTGRLHMDKVQVRTSLSNRQGV